MSLKGYGVRSRPRPCYFDRKSKARFVWQTYKSVLRGSTILDVGADEGYLREHLPDPSKYLGIGLGGSPDRTVDLEKEGLPFPADSFDCVLCLDVLEHLDNPHEIFDELCKVSRSYVIVSLPNGWAEFFNTLRSGNYMPGQALKYYGLPIEPPDDRHKWFFSLDEAEAFIRVRSRMNGMYVQDTKNTNPYTGRGLRAQLRQLALRIFFHRDLELRNLFSGTLWALLEKQEHA